jgi:hypothetical protein
MYFLAKRLSPREDYLTIQCKLICQHNSIIKYKLFVFVFPRLDQTKEMMAPGLSVPSGKGLGISQTAPSSTLTS